MGIIDRVRETLQAAGSRAGQLLPGQRNGRTDARDRRARPADEGHQPQGATPFLHQEGEAAEREGDGASAPLPQQRPPRGQGPREDAHVGVAREDDVTVRQAPQPLRQQVLVATGCAPRGAETAHRLEGVAAVGLVVGAGGELPAEAPSTSVSGAKRASLSERRVRAGRRVALANPSDGVRPP